MINRRHLLAGTVGAALTATLSATGCTTSSTPSGAGSSAAGGDQTLVVYSNSVSDGRGDWLTEQAKAAGFALQIVDLGGTDLMNRLIQEKNNPIADVTFGLNNIFLEKISAAGVLEDYKPAWASQVDPALGHADQFWPIVREPIMLVYSLDAYPDGKGAPTDWPDLWTKPEFKGKYETQTALAGATIQVVVAGILVRYRDDKGELGVSAEGWKQMAEFFRNGSPAVKGEDLYARMKAGKVTAGQMWQAGKATRETQYGFRTDAARPGIGVPMVVQHTALIRGTKKAATAKKFIDWLGSADVQSRWSAQFKTAPTNKEAVGDTEAVKFTDSFKRQEIDWEFVATHINDWAEKIELDYMGK